MSAPAIQVGGSGAGRTAAGRGRAVLRLGRRTVRAGGWRNALVVALIALGIAVAVVTAIGSRSTRVPADAHVTEIFGSAADVRVVVTQPFPSFADLSPELQASYLEAGGQPPAPAAPVQPVPEVVTDVAGPEVPLLGLAESYAYSSAQIRVLAVDLSDPLADGLVAGDPIPPGPGEVLLSPAAMAALDVGVGDEAQLPGADPARVVGSVEHPHRVAERLAVLGEGALGEPTVWLVDVDDPARQRQLAQALNTYPADASAEVAAAGPERYAQTRAEFVSETERTLARRVVEDPSFLGSLVGALLLTMVGLVAAAAFATGLRRRIREVGLLGATGASPRQVRQIALAEALVLGTAGAALGVALGVLAALLGRPLIQRISGTVVTDLQMTWTDLLGPALVGVAAAVLAALWPSITAARTSVTTALAGRVPLRSVPRWLPPASVVVTTTGLLLVALAIRSGGGLLDTAALGLGAVATALGAASLGVPLLGVGGRLADRLPATPRVVVRDAVRQRTRSGATVAALVLVLMVPMLVLTAFATESARFDLPSAEGAPTARVVGPYVDGIQLPVTEEVLAEVRALLPVEPEGRVDIVSLHAPGVQDGMSPVTAVPLEEVGGGSVHAPGLSPPALATDGFLDALGVDGDLAAAVVAGEVILDVAPPRSLSQQQRDAGRRQALLAVGGEATGDEVDLVTVEAPSTDLGGWLVLAADLAQEAGLTVQIRTVVLPLPRALDPDEATPIWEQGPTALGGAYVQVSTDGQLSDGPSPRLIGIGIALAMVLLITAVATALAATESDRDLQTMVAVGADPGIRPRFHGLQAAYHSGLAALLALPTAVLLYRVTQRGSPLSVGGRETAAVVVPWLEVAALGLGIPVVVGLLMWAAMRPARPVARRIS